jgi:kynurenine formamidase
MKTPGQELMEYEPQTIKPKNHRELVTQWLLDKRDIKAMGLDTPSTDYGQSKDFKTHQILHGKNKPGFENVANLDKLPPTGAYIVALPVKIGKGSGGPLRIIAGVPKS